jgi:hypothetical protein
MNGGMRETKNSFRAAPRAEAFTPSVENWIKLLDQVAAMDFDYILPAHGDVATRVCLFMA